MWKLAGKSPPYRGLVILLLAIVALAIYMHSRGEGDEAAAAMAEGERLFWLDNFLKARKSFVKAEVLYAKRGDERNALYAKVNRLRADADREGYPGVSAFLADQLARLIVLRDGHLRLRCLIVKAAIDLSIDPSSSARTWNEALLLAEQLGERGWIERAQVELGIIAFLEGRTTDAQALLRKAVTTAIFLRDVAGLVRALSLAAVGLLELGEHERALRYANLALFVANRESDLRFPLMAHMAKVGALEGLGRSAEAAEFLDRVSEFVTASSMSVYRADIQIALGHRAAKALKRDEAIQLFESAVRSAISVRMPRPEAAALFQLSKLYQESGDLARAEDRVVAGLAASRQLVDMYVLPRHLAFAAEIKSQLGKSNEAADLYDEATDLVEAMLVNVPSPRLRTSLIAAMSRIYVGHFRLAVEQMKDPRQAFFVVERARGRVAADELRAPAAAAAVRTPAMAKAERSITDIQVRLQHATDPEQRHELLEQLFVAEENLGPASLERRTTSIAVSEPVSIADLRRVLDRDEVIVEYVLAEPSSYALAVSRRAVRAYRLPPESLIRDLVDRLRQEISANQEAQSATSRRLYSSLIQMVPAIEGHRRIIIIPDGALHLLPFDVLQEPNGRYFGDDHIVTVSLSGTVLQLLRRFVKNEPASTRLLAVGMSDSPVSGAGLIAALSKDQRTRAFFDAAGADLSPLPATAEEIHSIADRAGPNGVVLTGNQATESGFKRQSLATFGVLHLALHGVADPKFPERSALVFPRDQNLENDGLLQVREVRSLQLKADLVTLSACETGLGRVEGQEGMANLVRAFLFAGARNVAAALWQVDDVFTSALMKSFYTRLAEGNDVSRALQRAKIDVRSKFGSRVKAHHWAGFQIFGEGRAQLRFGHPVGATANATWDPRP